MANFGNICCFCKVAFISVHMQDTIQPSHQNLSTSPCFNLQKSTLNIRNNSRFVSLPSSKWLNGLLPQQPLGAQPSPCPLILCNGTHGQLSFHESHHGIGSGWHVCPYATPLSATTIAVFLAGCTLACWEASARRHAVPSPPAFDTSLKIMLPAINQGHVMNLISSSQPYLNLILFFSIQLACWLSRWLGSLRELAS